MPLYEARRETTVAAPAADLFAVLTDYERLPEWQSRVCECRVLARDADGRAERVGYTIDARLRKVRYVLRHLYDEPCWIGSEYVEGDFRHFEGDYRFSESAHGTRVTFTLAIDPGFSVPQRVARMLNEAVMGRALTDLRRRVEEVGGGARATEASGSPRAGASAGAGREAS